MILSPHEHITLVAVQELTAWATFDGSDIDGWTIDGIVEATNSIASRTA